MKTYGKFIMLGGLCIAAYRRGGGMGLFAFGAIYTFADVVYARALRVIEERAINASRTEPTGTEGTDSEPGAEL